MSKSLLERSRATLAVFSRAVAIVLIAPLRLADPPAFVPIVSANGAADLPVIVHGVVSIRQVADNVLALDKVDCLECRVSLARLASLGDADGPGVVGPIFTLRQMQDGRYIVSYDAAASEMLLFAPDGKFIRTIGRSGAAPGEFRSIRWIRVSGGEVFVYDPGQRRLTVLAQDFRVVRTVPITGSALNDMAVVNDSLTVFNSVVRTRDLMGYLLHVFDAQGKIVRSMDEVPGGFRNDIDEFVYRRPLALAANGGVWSAHRTQYRIERWSFDGARHRTIVRRAAWFPDHISPPTPNATEAPKPFVQAVQEDGQGRLWVLTTVADTGWRRGLVANPRGRGENALRLIDPNKYFDSVMEVIDLKAGKLVASTRFDQWLNDLISPNQAASYEEDKNLNPKIVVWRFSLQQPAER